MENQDVGKTHHLLFDGCQNGRWMLLNSGSKHRYSAKEDAPCGKLGSTMLVCQDQSCHLPIVAGRHDKSIASPRFFERQNASDDLLQCRAGE